MNVKLQLLLFKAKNLLRFSLAYCFCKLFATLPNNPKYTITLLLGYLGHVYIISLLLFNALLFASASYCCLFSQHIIVLSIFKRISFLCMPLCYLFIKSIFVSMFSFNLQYTSYKNSNLNQLVADACKTLNLSPPKIIINNDFNACAFTFPIKKWLIGKKNNYLVIGIPILASLSLLELKAIILHELAHIANHDTKQFAKFYNLQRFWKFFLHHSTNKFSFLYHTCFFPFFFYYIPYFEKITSQISRQQEYQADLVANQHSNYICNALIRLENMSRHHQKHCQTEDSFMDLINYLKTNAKQRHFLSKQLQQSTSPTDSHPRILDRLKNLNTDSLDCPKITNTAFDELFTNCEQKELADLLKQNLLVWPKNLQALPSPDEITLIEQQYGELSALHYLEEIIYKDKSAFNDQGIMFYYAKLLLHKDAYKACDILIKLITANPCFYKLIENLIQEITPDNHKLQDKLMQTYDLVYECQELHKIELLSCNKEDTFLPTSLRFDPEKKYFYKAWLVEKILKFDANKPLHVLIYSINLRGRLIYEKTLHNKIISAFKKEYNSELLLIPYKKFPLKKLLTRENQII